MFHVGFPILNINVRSKIRIRLISFIKILSMDMVNSAQFSNFTSTVFLKAVVLSCGFYRKPVFSLFGKVKVIKNNTDAYGKPLSHLFDKLILSPINLLYYFDNMGLS